MAKGQKWRTFSPLWQKFSPLWQKWRENVRHFHHNGENGEKIDGKMAKMARMAKINGDNGEFFSCHFAMAKIEKKMANGNESPKCIIGI